MSVLDLAQNYVRDEYHQRLRRRDQMGILVKEALDKGDIVGALSFQNTQTRLGGEVEGLNIAITQLQMVKEEIER